MKFRDMRTSALLRAAGDAIFAESDQANAEGRALADEMHARAIKLAEAEQHLRAESDRMVLALVGEIDFSEVRE